MLHPLINAEYLRIVAEREQAGTVQFFMES